MSIKLGRSGEERVLLERGTGSLAVFVPSGAFGKGKETAATQVRLESGFLFSPG